MVTVPVLSGHVLAFAKRPSRFFSGNLFSLDITCVCRFALVALVYTRSGLLQRLSQVNKESSR